jgi:hypothetical protein
MSSTTAVERERRSPAVRWTVRVVLAVGIVGFVAFWTWALFFASKEAVNKIDDRAWAARAEQFCAEANEARLELSDYRSIVDADDTEVAALVRERADIVDRATDIVQRMLDDVVAVEPTDEKGRAIVPQWEAEYRSYIEARRTYADDLRTSGENLAFYEPGADGIPVSERLETFAGDNEMPSCAPPRDLTR